MDEVTVPVLVDSVKTGEDFPFTRCVYYTMEVQEPGEGDVWTAGFDSLGVPYVLLGSAAVLRAPRADHDLFDSPQLIEETFERIEQSEQFLVESNDLWVPTSRLSAAGAPDSPARGQVFRLGWELFMRAYQHRHGTIAQDRFVELCQALESQLRPSRVEAEAFADWSQRQIDTAREQYPKAPGLALAWQEDDLADSSEEGES